MKRTYLSVIQFWDPICKLFDECISDLCKYEFESSYVYTYLFCIHKPFNTLNIVPPKVSCRKKQWLTNLIC
jgi:hypothetical protein